MTFREARQYLDSFINHEIHLGQIKPASFKLERVQRLLENLGNPHKSLNIVHIAGSKGKGSICALTAGILQSSGYKTGLYTSPHINNYRERIRVLTRESTEPTPACRQAGTQVGSVYPDIFPDCISEEELCVVLSEIKPVIEKARSQKGSGTLSFFEIYTVLALYYFYKQKTDFVVLETGLGGRLDATNVVDPLVAAIAPVSLEHTHILGNTISRIAREKAAIIKNRRQKVVISPQSVEAREVLEKRCREFAINPLWVEGRVKYEDVVWRDVQQQVFDLITPGTKYKRLTLSLLGKHQRENAATSVCIIECLQDSGFAVSTDAIQEGLKNVFWPGRFEILKKEPLVILDGAHNAASAKVLSETIQDLFEGKKVILVLGISDDKDKESICNELGKIAGNIIFTKADHPRASCFEGAVDVKHAVDSAFKEADCGDIILVTGSIIVIAEARRVIKEREDSVLL